jgi:hypothetical protein
MYFIAGYIYLPFNGDCSWIPAPPLTSGIAKVKSTVLGTNIGKNKLLNLLRLLTTHNSRAVIGGGKCEKR